MIGETAALLASLLWAIGAVLYRKALQKIEPLMANLIRSTFGAAFMLLLYLTVKGPDFSVAITPLLYIIIGGIVGLGIGDLLFLGSLKHCGVARAVPVASTYPFFTMLISATLLNEIIDASMVLGTVLIVLGIWLLHENEEEPTHSIGILLALGTAVSWATAITITALGLRYVDPLLATAIRLPFVVGLLLVATLISGKKCSYEKESYAFLGIAGALSLGVGGFLFLYSVSTIQAAKATSLSSISPIFSTLLAVIFLKEKVTKKMFSGIISIIFGVWLI